MKPLRPSLYLGPLCRAAQAVLCEMGDTIPGGYFWGWWGYGELPPGQGWQTGGVLNMHCWLDEVPRVTNEEQKGGRDSCER